ALCTPLFPYTTLFRSTVTGVGRVLRRELGTAVRVIAVEPQASPVLSGGSPGLHGIQGLGAGFVPQILDREILDGVVQVSDVGARSEEHTSELQSREKL